VLTLFRRNGCDVRIRWWSLCTLCFLLLLLLMLIQLLILLLLLLLLLLCCNSVPGLCLLMQVGRSTGLTCIFLARPKVIRDGTCY